MPDGDVTERLARYSGYNPEFTPADAIELFEQAQQKCPVAHSDALGGFDILLEPADIKSASLDHRFTMQGGMLRPVVDRPMIAPVEYDPPEHGKWREIVLLGVNNATPSKIEGGVLEDIGGKIDDFAARGECDLVSEFCVPVPLLALCRILGLDTDKGDELRRLTVEHQAQLGNPDDHGAAFGRLAAFGLAEVASRRKQPRDDYLTALGQATLDGKLLEPEQIATIMISLLAAGHETSTLLMASMFYEVLSRPVIRDQLIADPSLISPAVEEVLRLHPPVMGLYRRTSEAVTVQGVEIAGGSDVMLCYAAGNRDPKVFDEPNEFRLDRKRNRHLTFGFGTHSCLGAPVARLEMRLGLAEVLRRLPDIDLVDKDLAYQFTGPEFVALPALRAKFTPET